MSVVKKWGYTYSCNFITSTWINISYRIIPTIRIQIATKQRITNQFRQKTCAIGRYKPADYRVVVSALEIIKSQIIVPEVASIPERIIVCNRGIASCYGKDLSPRIVAVLCKQYVVLAVDGNDVALEVFVEVILLGGRTVVVGYGVYTVVLVIVEQYISCGKFFCYEAVDLGVSPSNKMEGEDLLKLSHVYKLKKYITIPKLINKNNKTTEIDKNLTFLFFIFFA